jgi:hypothetical protein
MFRTLYGDVMIRTATIFFVSLVACVAGCDVHTGTPMNSDPKLVKKPAEYSADAVARHPMKTDLPKAGEADGVAEIDYDIQMFQLLNLSDTDWDNIEVWVNDRYVTFVPKIEAGKLRTLYFHMFYDGRGNRMPKAVKGEPRIQNIKMLRDDRWFDVKMTLADY